MNYIINAKSDEIHANVFYNARYSKKAIKNSINKNIPDFKEHFNWYKKQNLNNMFLIYDNGFVGYVRISDDNYVSIAVFDGQYNKGYGTFALSQIVKKYDILKAVIKKDNLESVNLFKKFSKIKIEWV